MIKGPNVEIPPLGTLEKKGTVRNARAMQAVWSVTHEMANMVENHNHVLGSSRHSFT